MIEGLDGLFGDPNGPAYQKHEERVGPPLSYVQEKLGNALRASHRIASAFAATQSGSHLPPLPSTVPPEVIDEYARNSLQAFHYNLIAFLALTNMLAAAADANLAERLVRYSAKEFDDWLDNIEQGGSVTG